MVKVLDVPNAKVGRGYLIDVQPDTAGAALPPFKWVFPPKQSGLQVVRVPGGGVVVVPQEPGEFSVGVAVSGEEVAWSTITAAGPAVPPARKSWLTSVKDAASVVPWKSVGKEGLIILVAVGLTFGGMSLRDWWNKRPPVDPPPIVDPVKPPVDPVTPKKPEPVIDPVITAAKVTVVIVEDTSAKTPAQAAVIMNSVMRAGLAKDGHEIEMISTKDPAYTADGYKSYADKVGLPAALVFDSSKLDQAQAPLAVFHVPATAAEFETSIRKVVRP